MDALGTAVVEDPQPLAVGPHRHRVGVRRVQSQVLGRVAQRRQHVEGVVQQPELGAVRPHVEIVPHAQGLVVGRDTHRVCGAGVVKAVRDHPPDVGVADPPRNPIRPHTARPIHVRRLISQLHRIGLRSVQRIARHPVVVDGGGSPAADPQPLTVGPHIMRTHQRRIQRHIAVREPRPAIGIEPVQLVVVLVEHPQHLAVGPQPRRIIQTRHTGQIERRRQHRPHHRRSSVGRTDPVVIARGHPQPLAHIAGHRGVRRQCRERNIGPARGVRGQLALGDRPLPQRRVNRTGGVGVGHRRRQLHAHTRRSSIQRRRARFRPRRP